jgi:hypothetical protein
MRHAPGLHPCDRLTAALGMIVLAVAMVLLGSIALAFYTQLESDQWLRLGGSRASSRRWACQPSSSPLGSQARCGSPAPPRKTCDRSCAGRSPR